VSDVHTNGVLATTVRQLLDPGISVDLHEGLPDGVVSAQVDLDFTCLGQADAVGEARHDETPVPAIDDAHHLHQPVREDGRPSLRARIALLLLRLGLGAASETVAPHSVAELFHAHARLLRPRAHLAPQVPASTASNPGRERERVNSRLGPKTTSFQRKEQFAGTIENDAGDWKGLLLWRNWSAYALKHVRHTIAPVARTCPTVSP